MTVSREVSSLKYFEISQHGGSADKIVYIPEIAERELDNAHGIVRQINDPKGKEFLNFYGMPYPIMSDKLKNTLKPYLPDAIGIPLSLANPSLNFVVIYWLLNLELVDNQGYNADKRLIINSSDISSKKIFKTKTGRIDRVIVDFDIAELILRSSIVDIQFSEISVI